MGTSAGPRNNSRDNLVFALDVADTNTITRWSQFYNMSTWTAGTGGATYYPANENATENERVEGTDPWGNAALVWEAQPSGNGNPDGGWNADYYSIDNTKLYRFSVWVKRTSSSAGGTFYLGTNGGGQCVLRLSDGGEECNPYWHCGGTSGLTQNQWYLVVGHCFPYTYNSSTGHPDTGFWTIDNGGQKVGSINGCNIGADCKSGPSTTSLRHRTYLYYCGDSTTRLQWYDPRMEVVDGTEPKIRELLKGPVHGTRNAIGGPIFGRLANGASYSPANGGCITLDGSNDWVDLNTSNLISGLNPFTIENVTTLSGGSYGAILGNYGSGYGSGLWWATAGLYIQGSVYHSNYSSTMAGTHHSAVTRDQNGNVVLYRDGVQVGTGTLGGSIPANINWRIGADVNGGGEALNGKIHALNVYNRVLTSQEIAENYANYKTRYSLP